MTNTFKSIYLAIIISWASFPTNAQVDSVSYNHGTFYGEWHWAEQGAPLVIILPGSGPIDRNGNGPSEAGNSLLYLADSLNAHGISTLNTDKYSASTSRFDTERAVSYDNFIELGEVWVSKANDMGYTDITVLGHSQGALTALLLADRPEVDRVISLCGAGRKINQILADQLTSQFPEESHDAIRAAFDTLGMGTRAKSPHILLSSMFTEQNADFVISWAKYDPCEVIRNVSVPVAIIDGSTDIQVNTSEADRLVSCAPSSSRTTVEGMGHMLKNAPSSRMLALQYYNNPQLPLSSGLAGIIAEFIKE